MSGIHTKTGAAALSVASNMLLVLLKLGVGFATGSVGVLSDAVHSGADLVAAVIALVSVRVAERPADLEHPYGHGKVENISALVEAGLILAAAAYIVYEALQRIRHPQEIRALPLALGVMTVSAVVNWFMSRHLFRVAAVTDSPALAADGHNLQVDVLTSGGVVVALGLIQFTRQPLLDPVVALVVACLIVRVAWGLIHESAGHLLDQSWPEAEQERLREVLDNEERILGYHRVRLRKSGSQRHVDMHLLLDPELNLQEAHDVAEKVEDDVRDAFPGAWVVTHVEPATEAELLAHAHEPGLRKGVPADRLPRSA